MNTRITLYNEEIKTILREHFGLSDKAEIEFRNDDHETVKINYLIIEDNAELNE